MSKQKMKFKCERHGFLAREDVVAWCNRCDYKDVVEKDGMLLCPSCFEEDGEQKFACRYDDKPVEVVFSSKD